PPHRARGGPLAEVLGDGHPAVPARNQPEPCPSEVADRADCCGRGHLDPGPDPIGVELPGDDEVAERAEQSGRDGEERRQLVQLAATEDEVLHRALSVAVTEIAEVDEQEGEQAESDPHGRGGHQRSPPPEADSVPPESDDGSTGADLARRTMSAYGSHR